MSISNLNRYWLNFGCMVVVAICMTFVGCGPQKASEEQVERQEWSDPQKQIELLGSNLPQVRILAVTNLGNAGKAAEDAIPALEKIAENDPEERVRTAAQEALGKIRQPEQ